MDNENFALENLRKALNYLDKKEPSSKSGRFIVSRREHLLKKQGCDEDDIAKAHDILSEEYSHLYVSYRLAENKLNEDKNNSEDYSGETVDFVEKSKESIDGFF
ncbi:hypothetical protein GF336_03790 [Candidatus Woesearchaeota archaeon]|nr:hypothetical protein [Candidatus Woesearchaeota archaeon]